ncbi:putative chitin synthase [Mycena polygramma]|nr:putative chitin synthase [Mycena polygramma]
MALKTCARIFHAPCRPLPPEQQKDLLLLGPDRYLTMLMLKTFPKRKNMFCPQVVCETVVPDTFRILLSQRRSWMNSTIHNLFEFVLVRDLCGTFCFLMQFVVGAGTLWAYVGWMLICLLSLPIWNSVLPAYAFRHFDAFSWGATRKIEGDETDTGRKEGSTHIFERERRWKNGTQARLR